MAEMHQQKSQLSFIENGFDSGDLIWKIVKKNNAFLVKQFESSRAKVLFSKEKKNLYNIHSYKFSGLANKKIVSIQPAADGQSIELATTKRRKQRKPAQLYHKSMMKRDFRKWQRL